MASAAIRRLAPALAGPGAAAGAPAGAALLEQRHKCFPSSSAGSRDCMEQKSHTNERKEDIYQRLSASIDKLSDSLAEHSRLLKQLEARLQEDSKHDGAIDLTPWVVSIPASFLLVALYNYVKG